jgi:hypothetical protein
MKTLIFTLVLSISTLSCISVEKMIQRGEYDRAFSYALKKIGRSNSIKSEYIIALEKSYRKLNDLNHYEIDRLNAENRPENLARTISNYEELDRRNRLVKEMSPITSIDGYTGSFEFNDYRSYINNTIDSYCAYIYNGVEKSLAKADKNKDKQLAKEAYHEIDKIEKYNTHYRDIDVLKERALALGLTRVMVDIDNNLYGSVARDIEHKISNLPVSKLDNIWYDYSLGGFEDGRNADLIMVVKLENIDFGRESERINNYTEDITICVRKETIKEKRDTSYVYVEKEVFEKFNAHISELWREKKSQFNGSVKVFDNRDKSYTKNVPITVYHDFQGYACRYVGDERALTSATKCKLDNVAENFPSEYDLVDALTKSFGDVVINEGRKIRKE